MHFLLSYCTTAPATTKVEPADLFLNRHVRFDFLHPNVEETVSNSQAQQKKGHDQHVSAREFIIGQRVLVCNYRPGPSWLPGTIMSCPGPLTYLVQVVGNCVWKCYIDQLLQTSDSPQNSTPVPSTTSVPIPQSPSSELPDYPAAVPVPEFIPRADQDTHPSVTGVPDSEELPPRRYPQRTRRPPDRYQDTDMCTQN